MTSRLQTSGFLDGWNKVWTMQILQIKSRVLDSMSKKPQTRRRRHLQAAQSAPRRLQSHPQQPQPLPKSPTLQPVKLPPTQIHHLAMTVAYLEEQQLVLVLAPSQELYFFLVSVGSWPKGQLNPRPIRRIPRTRQSSHSAIRRTRVSPSFIHMLMHHLNLNLCRNMDKSIMPNLKIPILATHVLRSFLDKGFVDKWKHFEQKSD